MYIYNIMYIYIYIHTHIVYIIESCVCVSYLLSKEKIGKHKLAKLLVCYRIIPLLFWVWSSTDRSWLTLTTFLIILALVTIGRLATTVTTVPTYLAKLPNCHSFSEIFQVPPPHRCRISRGLPMVYPFCQAALWPKRRVLMVSFAKFSARN